MNKDIINLMNFRFKVSNSAVINDSDCGDCTIREYLLQLLNNIIIGFKVAVNRKL